VVSSLAEVESRIAAAEEIFTDDEEDETEKILKNVRQWANNNNECKADHRANRIRIIFISFVTCELII
jgi:hypothetical protein